jgi:hypothetical protein
MVRFIQSLVGNLDPVAGGGLGIAAFCAGIPFHAKSMVLEIIEFANLPPQGLAGSNP